MYTALQVPQLGALLDIGVALRSFCSTSNLFLSHGHLDHIGGFFSLLGMRGLVGVRKLLKIHLPSSLVEPLQEAMTAFTRLHHWPLEAEMRPMEPGDELLVGGGIWVKAFQTLHPVPSLGYLFFHKRQKLLPEFHGLPGREIQQRKRAGEALFREERRLELAYATDTLPEILDEVPELLEVPILIMECSFLDKRKSLKAARGGGHVHLEELKRYLPHLKNRHLLLMHFSQIYKPTEIYPFFKDLELEPELHLCLPKQGRTWWE